MEEAKVRYYETNEGRETAQGFAGFQGNNVLLLIGAVGLSLILSQGVNNLGFPVWANFLIMGAPVLVVSAYVFGLKQGKPPSYDVELAEWLIIKLTGVNFLSPKQVQPLKLPWLESPSKEKTNQSSTDGQTR
jgi:hypothetical protein